MRKTLLLGLIVFAAATWLRAQCPVTNITGNFSPLNGDTLSGTYNITGNFTLGPGITVHVRPLSSNGCGALEINTGGNVFVAGTINANAAGNLGGLPGAAGLANNINNIEACSSPTDLCADIIPFGGAAGATAFGSGGGLGGLVGQNGSGRKNRCLNFGDEGGRAGGGGGAGAGAGGSYGGTGTNGANGGNASLPTMSTSDVNCTATVIALGAGSTGGAAALAFGTVNGQDIDLGAGGGGAGGGGRGRFAGLPGTPAGRGGGSVRIVAGGTLTFTGTINANGTDGQVGGRGGNAGSSSRCCSDACAGVDEYTHTGAGGGGGGAGGGSGGGVLLQATGTASVTGTINSRGGNGGNGGNGGTGFSMTQNCILGNSNANAGPGSAGGQGGGGGGGRIKVFFNPCANGNNIAPTMNVNGGNGNAGPALAGTTYTGAQSGLTLGAATPALQTLCFNGDPGNLNSLPPTGGLSGFVYQWQSQANCMGAWINIPGANALNYDPPAGIQDTTCYRLQVTSGACTSFSDTLRVDVYPNLTVPVLPTGPVIACLGDSIPLTTSGGSGATYQWYQNGIPLLAATDSFLVATTTGAYTVEVTYPIGCNGFSAPVTATFSPPPSAFAIALGDTVYCPGFPLDLLAVGNGSFQWQLNGVPIPGATAAHYYASLSGNYAVAVTLPGGCTATSDSVTISAGAVPVAGLLAGGITHFCAGDSVVLTASGGGSYAWLVDGQPLFGVNAGSLAAYTTGAYQVIATSVDGCSDTTVAINVLADPSPTAILNPAGSPITCLGDSVVFYAQGGGSYQWLYNQAPLPDTTPYYHAGLQGDYTVIVTNSAGCSDTSVTFAFTYYPPINTTVTALGNVYLCPGDSVDLLANGAGSLGWTWTQNDTLLTGATQPIFTATEPGAYAAYSTDVHGCNYSSALLMVYPGQDPDAHAVLNGDVPACPRERLLIVGTGGGSYTWLRDGVLLQGETDSTLFVTVEGDYALIVETGCGADTSQVVAVTYGNGPTAGLQWDNYPMSLVQFRDQSISAAQWLWTFGDGSGSSTLQNPEHQFPNPGEYAVTLIVRDIYGCVDTLSMIVTVTDPDFFIPNVFSPNADGINDQAMTNFKKLDVFEFHIYDRWGRLVWKTDVQDTWWDGKIGAADAPEGVYFYYLRGMLPQEREAEQRGPITLMR